MTLNRHSTLKSTQTFWKRAFRYCKIDKIQKGKRCFPHYNEKDIRKIKKNMLILTDKTNNIYEMLAEHNEKLLKTISRKHKESTRKVSKLDQSWSKTNWKESEISRPNRTICKSWSIYHTEGPCGLINHLRMSLEKSAEIF